MMNQILRALTGAAALRSPFPPLLPGLRPRPAPIRHSQCDATDLEAPDQRLPDGIGAPEGIGAHTTCPRRR